MLVPCAFISCLHVPPIYSSIPSCLLQIIQVPPLDSDGRLKALQVHSSRLQLACDVDLAAISAQLGSTHSGAHIAAICHEAALAALRETPASSVVEQKHFIAAVLALRF